MNATDNFYKETVQNDHKMVHVPHSNISQLIESVEGCGDYLFQKQVLAGNITPVFSVTEELAEPLRPNGLEMNSISNPNISVSHNLPAFHREGDVDMMLTEEFKNPIDAHNQ